MDATSKDGLSEDEDCTTSGSQAIDLDMDYSEGVYQANKSLQDTNETISTVAVQDNMFAADDCINKAILGDDHDSIEELSSVCTSSEGVLGEPLQCYDGLQSNMEVEDDIDEYKDCLEDLIVNQLLAGPSARTISRSRMAEKSTKSVNPWSGRLQDKKQDEKGKKKVFEESFGDKSFDEEHGLPHLRTLGRFRRGLLTEVCEELKISHRHSTPYYPQSNGLVEKANGIIAGIIRKMVESRQEQNNDEAWIDRLLNLVELEWKRKAAYHCYEKKALQLKDKLNEGIKDKQIKEKSLVLRYNNALDIRFDAKFERRWEGPFIVKKAFTGGYYQLMDLNGKEHLRKVNGYRLKPYLSRILPAVFETKQVSKKTKKVCCHCCSDTHQVKSCAFQHVLKEVAKNQKEKLSSPTSCPESSFQYDPVDGT
ncbi:hypothetical protein L7F22_037513 [Adiantum nelumboides]|nr:hypothetical protein [Adiantum nelumboides]